MSDNFIWGDFINDEVVDLCVDFYNTQKFLPYFKGEIHCPELGHATVDKSRKDSLDLPIPIVTFGKQLEPYKDELQRILELYVKKFPYCASSFQIKEEAQIQKYPIGGGYKSWHTERSVEKWPMVYRHLVFMTYLNDVPDGGTEWYHQDLYVPAQKGYTVIWPSDWTHIHRGRVSHTKEKMIITGWYSFV